MTGAKVTEETSWLAGLIMNIVFLLGLFTFAVVLGIISEEIKTQVSARIPCHVGSGIWTQTAQPCRPSHLKTVFSQILCSIRSLG